MLQPKVLVVDDEENILSAFKNFLMKEHCEMVAASNAEEAMMVLEKQHMNLLITDIRLKGTSGVTFFMEAKRIHPKLPVIVITGYPDLITEEAIKEYGADFFFLKPLDLGKLRNAIRRCL
jgi:two-component system, NtrC family, nitrogen regulation response regulator GlnG